MDSASSAPVTAASYSRLEPSGNCMDTVLATVCDIDFSYPVPPTIAGGLAGTAPAGALLNAVSPGVKAHSVAKNIKTGGDEGANSAMACTRRSGCPAPLAQGPDRECRRARNGQTGISPSTFRSTGHAGRRIHTCI